MLSFFPRDVLDEICDLIESVSEGFPTYSCSITVLSHEKCLEEIGILLGKPQPANNIGPIRVPYGILYGSNMGNPKLCEFIREIFSSFYIGFFI